MITSFVSLDVTVPLDGESAILIAGQCAPHFLFGLAEKKTGPCTVQKKRTLLAATLHRRAKLLYGSLPRRCRQNQSVSCRLAPGRSFAPVLRRVSGAAENRGGHRIDLLLFPLPLTLPRRTRERVAAAQPLAALPPYAGQPFTAPPCYGCRVPPAGRCGVPLAGKAEGAKIEAGQIRFCNPSKSAVLARVGSHNLAEDLSVPVGQAKSEQAPVRRPPSARRHGRAGARQSAFSLPPGAARSLFGAAKKRTGGAPPWEQPPGGSQTPEAAFRRPKITSQRQLVHLRCLRRHAARDGQMQMLVRLLGHTPGPGASRVRKPSCMRYGSYTSSSVTDSSPMVAARVSKPTGPPP